MSSHIFTKSNKNLRFQRSVFYLINYINNYAISFTFMEFWLLILEISKCIFILFSLSLWPSQPWNSKWQSFIYNRVNATINHSWASGLLFKREWVRSTWKFWENQLPELLENVDLKTRAKNMASSKWWSTILCTYCMDFFTNTIKWKKDESWW